MGEKRKKTGKLRMRIFYLTVSSAVRFDGPTSLVAESFEDLIVVAVLWELEVAVHSQPSEDLRGYGSPPPLPPLVVLSLLPCRQPSPRRHPSLCVYLSLTLTLPETPNCATRSQESSAFPHKNYFAEKKTKRERLSEQGAFHARD